MLVFVLVFVLVSAAELDCLQWMLAAYCRLVEPSKRLPLDHLVQRPAPLKSGLRPTRSPICLSPFVSATLGLQRAEAVPGHLACYA